ncbi:LysR family transcriptional regulator [Pseudorhodoferax sp. Leaf267]|uniref:LysR family transcriptional regulator n=1 Tax=Pseudorhodoferax sp. Leaf267 TaxID=1736316 RepID=UPI0006F8F5BA|nr:LysR family transcriptional regulator [Pseudorhodoferax sp. Leaf267]KQP18324.1 LysR family transcriptional regulator [Pseudorhodoferax sp. Leaf267]
MNDTFVELRVWRQFLTVAEELHFGRAAHRLHMTQPPLTQAIAQLERALGVPLFERTSRRVALTPAGQALLPDVRDLLTRAQALPMRAREAAGGEVGRIRLAFVSTVGFEQLPAWVRAFRAANPRVALELVEATGDVQLQAFERGEIDAGFMLHSPGFAPPALAHLQVATEPLVLALPAHHPLAAAERPAWPAVLAEPLVIFPRRIVPSLHDAVFGLYHAAGRLPVVAQEAIQMQTIVNLVSAGIGVAWVPESVMQFRRQGVVYRVPDARKRKGQPGATPVCETSLVWRGEVDGAGVAPALARFVAFVRAQVEEGD